MLVHVCDKCSKIIDKDSNVDLVYNYYGGKERILPHMYKLHLCAACFEDMFGKGTLEKIKNENDNKEGM